MEAIGEDTKIYIVARTIEHPTSSIITLDDQTSELGCDGKCLALIIKKIAAPVTAIDEIIFMTSSIDVNNDYTLESTEQNRGDSLIVAFLSALRGITTTAIATAGYHSGGDNSLITVIADNKKKSLKFQRKKNFHIQNFMKQCPSILLVSINIQNILNYFFFNRLH